MGKDLRKVFKNKHTPISKVVRTQINQVNDIEGASPRKHYKERL